MVLLVFPAFSLFILVTGFPFKCFTMDGPFYVAQKRHDLQTGFDFAATNRNPGRTDKQKNNTGHFDPDFFIGPLSMQISIGPSDFLTDMSDGPSESDSGSNPVPETEVDKTRLNFGESLFNSANVALMTSSSWLAYTAE